MPENLHRNADAEKRVAQLGLRLIEESILTLLRSSPEGLGNSEIARQLNLGGTVAFGLIDERKGHDNEERIDA